MPLVFLDQRAELLHKRIEVGVLLSLDAPMGFDELRVCLASE